MLRKSAVLMLALVFAVSLPCLAQEAKPQEATKDVKQQESKEEEVKKEETVKEGEEITRPELQQPFQPKTWQVPSYVAIALQAMVDNFNRKYNAELERIKRDLVANFPGFEDMPINSQDILYFPNKDAEGNDIGIFITREDYIKLQKQQSKKK